MDWAHKEAEWCGAPAGEAERLGRSTGERRARVAAGKGCGGQVHGSGGREKTRRWRWEPEAEAGDERRPEEAVVGVPAAGGQRRLCGVERRWQSSGGAPGGQAEGRRWRQRNGADGLGADGVLRVRWTRRLVGFIVSAARERER
ncbi:hypothetical protein E2562_010321 [Oryza meyeriana var. granulata]|uniref:DUF834 domain-containing protein n=1 Tax=Oryza meyeriana var. granulata TaxID=110450 RepID=A0A6G1F665_9ORYZ|nr:hypothetical protein E2562_010321 [Oryza meyeriana var. granulata]